MALFSKRQKTALPPCTVWEYRSGDGWHWGFHYRLVREAEGTMLHYSRVMPEQMQCIAARDSIWEELYAIAERYNLMSWEGFDRCKPKTGGRTKRWLLYLTFENGEHLRAEGCGAYPKGHEAAENEMLRLLNALIDME